MCLSPLEVFAFTSGFFLLTKKKGKKELSDHIQHILISLFCFLQRVPPAPTRCPPGSRSVFPARPTASRRMKDRWCACARRTTSGRPWTRPRRRAQVIRSHAFIFPPVWLFFSPHHFISAFSWIISRLWSLSHQPVGVFRISDLGLFIHKDRSAPPPGLTRPSPCILSTAPPLFSSLHLFVWPAPTSFGFCPIIHPHSPVSGLLLITPFPCLSSPPPPTFTSPSPHITPLVLYSCHIEKKKSPKNSFCVYSNHPRLSTRIRGFIWTVLAAVPFYKKPFFFLDYPSKSM